MRLGCQSEWVSPSLNQVSIPVPLPSSGSAAQNRGRLYRDFGLGLRIVTPLGGVERDLPFWRLCGRSPRGAGSRGRSSGRPWRSRTGSSLHSDCCPPCRTERRGTPAPLWGHTHNTCPGKRRLELPLVCPLFGRQASQSVRIGASSGKQYLRCLHSLLSVS